MIFLRGYPRTPCVALQGCHGRRRANIMFDYPHVRAYVVNTHRYCYQSLPPRPHGGAPHQPCCLPATPAWAVGLRQGHPCTHRSQRPASSAASLSSGGTVFRGRNTGSNVGPMSLVALTCLSFLSTMLVGSTSDSEFARLHLRPPLGRVGLSFVLLVTFVCTSVFCIHSLRFSVCCSLRVQFPVRSAELWCGMQCCLSLWSRCCFRHVVLAGFRNGCSVYCSCLRF